ncbi:hypothetical protein T265_05698 [Opisthorchis viverrini]|uniref:Uncharacterized protein n=1 Tax=Opisthorchis viverrini TaxID=6198 RepID=A0A074ZNB2_OPIVI|nr:hypothetical protein T265_05698 [Opisthorchis viverrini]KER27232.1 hypothetical protein T265_05698 [Opisthorchis viverrini]
MSPTSRIPRQWALPSGLRLPATPLSFERPCSCFGVIIPIEKNGQVQSPGEEEITVSPPGYNTHCDASYRQKLPRTPEYFPLSCRCNIQFPTAVTYSRNFRPFSRQSPNRSFVPKIPSSEIYHNKPLSNSRNLLQAVAFNRRQSAIQQLLQAGEEHGRVRSGYHPGRLELPHSLLAVDRRVKIRCKDFLRGGPVHLPRASSGRTHPSPGPPGGSSALPTYPGRSVARQPPPSPQSPPERSEHPRPQRVAATGSSSLSRSRH